ncbi:hypothetical protein O1611_g915 [Lasiodiplodia mahajangana]|uniref:Uncharacterized protein n=1 Tax=Lasiodiplodia mahajangana TaxID=1108764 RepID=A0ACC2JZ05_9PEZI|nr:hypothetical protein O1611_g915 [Lasiodiplodia mahajangana]
MSSLGSDISHDWELATELASLDASTEDVYPESNYTRHGELSSSPPLYAVGSVLDNNSPSSGTSVSHLQRAPMKRSPMSVEGEKLQVRQSLGDKGIADRAFRFDPNDPPSLSQLAVWLGLNHAVEVALLLDSFAIRHSFAAYGSMPGQARTANPECLRFVVPLFTYSRETLLCWRSRFRDEIGGNIDFSAALFANQVVRYLERSVDFVAWSPLTGHESSIEAFEIARWRFAVALQMLWFLEKAFVRPGELSN